MIKKFLVLMLFILNFHEAFAGGVSLGTTRVIYPLSKDQVTLKIYNTDKDGNYLVQSWVTNDKNVKIKDFIITPPLFVLKGGSENLLNIIFTGEKSNLPQDRERLYYLNSKVIPSISEHEQNSENALLISTTTRIKLFVRPDLIKEDPNESYKKMICKYENGKIEMRNNSPFYLNLVALSVNGKLVSDAETISPMSSIYLQSDITSNSISYNFINDYGVQIKDRHCQF